jgi:hypothetical protein
MKALYRKLLIAISALLLIIFSYSDTNSCGPYYYADECRIMLFRSYLSGADNMQSFYYTPAFSSRAETDRLKIDNHRNCNEWHLFTGKQVSLKDIYEVQYAMSPDDFLYTIRHRANNDDNTFIHWLLQPAHKAVLDYFTFAKTIEFVQAASSDPWQTDETYYNVYFFDSLANVSMQQCEHSTTSFLQERYAFQAIKLLSYSCFAGEKKPAPHFAKRTRACYEKYLLNKKTMVADWGLIYYANAQPDEKNKLLMLLQAFDRSEEKKAYVNNYLSTKKLRTLKSSVNDPATRTLITAVAAIKNPGRALNEIREISAADPTNKYLPLLICREVNKLEDWLLSPELLGFSAAKSRDSEKPYQEKILQRDRLYLQQVRDQLITMLQYPSSDKTLLTLAIVHLFQVNHQYPEAAAYLQAIHTKNPRYLKQQAIASAINLIYTADVTRPEVQQTLYQQFTAIARTGEETYDLQEYEAPSTPSKTISQLYLALSWQMKAKGDIVKAGLLFQKANLLVNDYYGFYDRELFDRDTTEVDTIYYHRIAFFDKYAAPADIDALLSFKHKSRKTPFDQLIAPAVWSADNFYLDLKGTIQLRQKQYKAAMATFNGIPDHFWEENYDYRKYLPRNYIGSTIGLKGIDKTPRKKYPYASKKMILQDMITLMDSLETATLPAEKARLSLLTGNALFNISRAGNAWMMFSYGKGAGENSRWWGYWSDWAWYNFYPNNKTYEQPYYNCADAMRLYQQAIVYAGSNKELAAQATVMLAVCDEAIHEYHTYDNEYYSPYRQQFKKRYGSTEAFTAAVSSCPDIAAWANKF